MPFPRDIAPTARSPFTPGPLIAIANASLEVTIAPQAGGRVAQIRHRGVEQLVGYDEANAAMIAWGCYAMVPWAGRIRNGRFTFRGRTIQLPLNLDAHAIHGVGFGLPWQVEAHAADRAELSLALPEDERWPFGGAARQILEVGEAWIRMHLSVTAGAHAMPACIGWHPWFRKPDRLEFSPQAIYPRDADGIATVPPIAPTPGPWDDCFINHSPVRIHRSGQCLRLAGDTSHWVVYDQAAHATCVEPQSGPPDAFNIAPSVLAAGETLQARLEIAWERLRPPR